MGDEESFRAESREEVYQSEELVPFYSHSPLRPERPSDDYSGGGKHRKKPRRPLGAEKLESETFKSSNNYNSVMDAESKFDKLSHKIAKQYEKKGMSPKEAKEIGNKTAYTIGARKYGKAGMARKARAGMRAESFGAEPELVGGPCEICDEDLFRDYNDSMGDVCLSCYYEERSKQDDEGSEYDGWLLHFAESFEAQGNPDKRTTTQYAKFYVGFEDDEGELRGGGKFKKYDDALAQADIVSEREGNSRIVTTRGFALLD